MGMLMKSETLRRVNHGRPRAAQGGFTLVEALVALVILSVGLLGVAKLVMAAVHADDSAYMRGQATQLAYEMLDEIRANRPAAIDGSYANAAAAADCSTTACSPDTLAGEDLYEWQQRLAGALPSGAGTVTMATDANGNPVATITVSWDDSQAQWSFGTSSSTAHPAAMTLTLESVL
jgi:type IV pilus assembly protein PilV